MPELKPGFASAEPETSTPVQPQETGDPHYAGMTDEEARQTWERETLCTRCLCCGVCAVAMHTEGPLVVISRCLSYLPVST